MMMMMMTTCSFCGGAAHPATGCVYGERTIACRRCTVQFWSWLLSHVNKKKPKRRAGRAEPSVSFYEAAGKR